MAHTDSHAKRLGDAKCHPLRYGHCIANTQRLSEQRGSFVDRCERASRRRQVAI